jgi:hypothetical protein
MTKRQMILLGFSPFLLYGTWVLAGMAAFSAGWVKEWPIGPNYIITDSDHDADTSRAGSDGPHIFYRSDSIIVKSVVWADTGFAGKQEGYLAQQRDRISIACRFDEHPEWNFTTRLKPTLVPESTTYPTLDSALAISDIEGQFGAFRALLLKNGLMNEHYEWTFGTGHLILVGDFFDRGLNVTECLWLIYHLEGEAARQGGKVHLILGNHEIMNMQGDLRYVRNKYIDNTFLIRENYKRWYTPQTELGRWLQTKNVVEKIGPLLAVHGGISEEVLALRASLDEIADRVRPFYFDTSNAAERSDARTKTLFSYKHGPFWYRDYVNESAPEALVQRVAQQYGVDHILVGHTVVPHVAGLYGGRVIALDTRHAEGVSEAVFFRRGKFYRVDTSGARKPLGGFSQ